MKNLSKLTRAYALKNALAHDGDARQGAVISALFNEGLKKSDVPEYAKEIAEIILEVNGLSPEKQREEFEKLKHIVSEREVREGLPELPGAKKDKVIMRFRPSPSGPLHVGHIISNMISSLFVKEYGGKFYVVIDDTDPVTTLKDSYKNIKKDCDWIFGNVYKYLNASDRMSLYYSYAEKLIWKGYAYVCTCKQEAFKKTAMDKRECSCRNISVEEQEKRWKKMLDKKGFKEGQAVLRFKTSEKHKGMKNPNPALRDFPLARISEKVHPLQKKKYRVWPLMNLAVSVDDIELGMTHVIRGKDHRDNAERQKLIFEVFGKKFPWVGFIGRIKFTDMVLSKRQITAKIESGEFSGFEDEKLPTIASLRKRGYKPEAFARFAEQRGLTEVDKVISSKDFFDVVDRLNK